MSKQLSEQASELWKTISSPQTAETYQNTLSITWQILKRLGLTIWLALCLVLVGADWVTGTALSGGKSMRAWVEKLKNSDSEQLTAMTSEQMLTIGKQGLANAVVNARKQLGLSEQTVTPLLAPADTAEVSTSETAKVAAEPVKKA